MAERILRWHAEEKSGLRLRAGVERILLEASGAGAQLAIPLCILLELQQKAEGQRHDVVLAECVVTFCATSPEKASFSQRLSVSLSSRKVHRALVSKTLPPQTHLAASCVHRVTSSSAKPFTVFCACALKQEESTGTVDTQMHGLQELFNSRRASKRTVFLPGTE